MKYTLIKGTYHVVGQSPDADSLKFRAANPAHWSQLDTENRAIFEREFAENNGVVILRLEGVDALETHYSAPPLPTPADLTGKVNAANPAPKPMDCKQPSDLGRVATHRFLELLGVTGVKWRTFGKSVYISEAQIGSAKFKTKLSDAIPGCIVTGDVEKNGRPVSWVFYGDLDLPDGAAITREQLAALAPKSANYQLLRMGVVYPFYFMTLAGVLRNALNDAVREALVAAQLPDAQQRNPYNIWLLDCSTRGVTLDSMDVLINQQAIYPYVFRKIVKHQYAQQMARFWAGLRGLPVAADDGRVLLDGFFNDANPYVFVISDQDFLRLDDVIEARGTTLRMKKPPYDLVFLS